MQIQILKFIQIHILRHESKLELAKTLHAKKKNLLKQRRKKEDDSQRYDICKSINSAHGVIKHNSKHKTKLSKQLNICILLFFRIESFNRMQMVAIYYNSSRKFLMVLSFIAFPFYIVNSHHRKYGMIWKCPNIAE